jgi:small GTP-binding protein
MGGDGLELLAVIGNKTVGTIANIAWSPDGRSIALAGARTAIYEWDGRDLHRRVVLSDVDSDTVAWSPDGAMLALAGIDRDIYVLASARRFQLDARLTVDLPSNRVSSVAWSPDGATLAAGGDGELLRWMGGPVPHLFRRAAAVPLNSDWVVRDLAWSPGGVLLAFQTSNGVVGWTAEERPPWRAFSPFTATEWLDTGRLAVGGAGSVDVFETAAGDTRTRIEGRPGQVVSLAASAGAVVLASQTEDGAIQLWTVEDWKPIGLITGDPAGPRGRIAFHPSEPILAVVSDNGRGLQLWRLDVDRLARSAAATAGPVHYTTARIALVGDSGVGKTGLGWRLAHGDFKEQASTHGQQFWVVDELGRTRADGTRCEAVLWDLAGQPDYRLVHSLYLDDIDVALIVFDAANRQDPLGAVDYWLRQLGWSEGRSCVRVLVAARADRGTPTLSDDELRNFCDERGIEGGFLVTSALTGEGVAELLRTVTDVVPWNELTATVTSAAFKAVKDVVLALKADPTRADVLVRPAELRALSATDDAAALTENELLTAVRHLESHGYVKVLRGSDGEPVVLLRPDLLANLSASIVLEARRNQAGLGFVEEERLLQGDYGLPELAGLSEVDQDLLLDAATSLFVRHNICFRETHNERVLLVFPSLINEKPPMDGTDDLVEGVSYRITGPVENVYASMVVLLGYTNTFTRTNQWRGHARYELDGGEGSREACGFRLAGEQQGQLDVVLLHGSTASADTLMLFQGLFERFVRRRQVEVTRFAPALCPTCGEALARNVVLTRIEKGHDFGFCSNCGERLSLAAGETIHGQSQAQVARLAGEQDVARRRTAYETALVAVKALLRDGRDGKEPPSCFLSYAWGEREHEQWVVRLARDLRNAGIDVLLDRWDNPAGHSLSLYLDRVLGTEYVVVVGTPELRRKYEDPDADAVVAAELLLVNTRLRQPSRYGTKVIPLLLDGDRATAFTPQLQDVVGLDFTDEDMHFVRLFELVWRIFELPADHPRFEELRESLVPERF